MCDCERDMDYAHHYYKRLLEAMGTDTIMEFLEQAKRKTGQ